MRRGGALSDGVVKVAPGSQAGRDPVLSGKAGHAQAGAALKDGATVTTEELRHGEKTRIF